MKWHNRFLSLAEHIASWSKDPSTRVGAVIVRPDRTIASVGYNGFPRGMDDDPALYADRETKYSRIIHAEMNAILNAKESLLDYTLYTWPFFTCDSCAVHVIQVGIKHVVCRIPSTISFRWGEKIIRAENFYKEAGVSINILD